MTSKSLSIYAQLILTTVLLLLQGCGVQRFVPEGELLYGGSEIQLTKNDSIEQTKKIKNELQGLLQPTPNTKLLGIKLPLYFHYKAQQENRGFLMKWLGKKFGEEPVYFSNVNTTRMEDLMRNRLE